VTHAFFAVVCTPPSRSDPDSNSAEEHYHCWSLLHKVGSGGVRDRQRSQVHLPIKFFPDIRKLVSKFVSVSSTWLFLVAATPGCGW
jgi:hypothetical protein